MSRRQKKLKLFGKWMYERSDILDLIKLIERGMLKLGEQGGSRIVSRFPLHLWKEAWDMAVDEAGFGRTFVIQP